MNQVPQPKMFNSKKYRDNYSEIDWSSKSKHVDNKNKTVKLCMFCGEILKNSDCTTCPTCSDKCC